MKQTVAKSTMLKLIKIRKIFIQLWFLLSRLAQMEQPNGWLGLI